MADEERMDGEVVEESGFAEGGQTESSALSSGPEAPSQVKGSVKIADEVIGTIAGEILRTFKGVRGTNVGLIGGLKFGKRPFAEGVRVEVEEGGSPSVKVDLFVNVKYGLRIPDVAWELQESVKKGLEELTGYRVSEVNVFVQGLFFKEEELKPSTAYEARESGGEPPRSDSDA